MIAYITLNKKDVTDFARARNELLLKHKADWIFFVDSDEVITTDLKNEITDLVYEKGDKYNGFYVRRKIFFLGKVIGEDKVLRLAKKGKGKWRRAVHEVWDIKGKVGNLRNYLIHSTATHLNRYINKINKYSHLHAQENLKEGKRSNVFKIIFFPFFKFLENFLSGRGFVFSMLQSFHSFLAWSELWILQKG